MALPGVWSLVKVAVKTSEASSGQHGFKTVAKAVGEMSPVASLHAHRSAIADFRLPEMKESWGVTRPGWAGKTGRAKRAWQRV